MTALTALGKATGVTETMLALSPSAEMLGDLALALGSNIVANLFERAVDFHVGRDGTEPRHDLHRVVGLAVASVLDGVAKDAGIDRSGKVWLKHLASTFKGDDWASFDQIEIPRIEGANVHLAVVEAGVNTVISTDDWRQLLLDVHGRVASGGAWTDAHDEALDQAAQRLSEKFTSALHTEIARAWAARDPAWPALTLRIAGETLKEAKRASSLASDVGVRLQRLEPQLESFLQGVSGEAFAYSQAPSIDPGTRERVLRDVIASQRRIEEVVEFKFRDQARLVHALEQRLTSTIEANADAIRYDIERLSSTALLPSGPSFDVSRYLSALVAHPDFRRVASTYVPVPYEPELTGRRLTAESAKRRRQPGSGRPIVDVAENHRRLVVIGEPGAGKTSALMHLTLSQARLVMNGAGDLGTPIFVSLSDWATVRQQNEHAVLSDLLCHSITRWSGLPSNPALMNTLLADDSKPPFTLVFDGLDEIRHLGGRHKFVTLVVELLASSPRHAVVIGSRRYGFTNDLRGALHEFAVYEPRRLDDQAKHDIISKYTNRDRVEVLTAINKSYRIARLSDNALLLRLFAEQYVPGVELSKTRGRALERHVDRSLGEVNLFATSGSAALYGKQLLSDVAKIMRDGKRTTVDENDESMRQLGHDAPGRAGIARGQLFDALVESRLVERLPNESLQFALPQIEDFFRARIEVAALREAHKANKSIEERRALPVIADPELQEVLVMASGLLERRELESTLEAMNEETQLLMMARMLGEADAPDAEARFIRKLDSRVTTAVTRALTGVARLWFAILFVWWLSMLPLAMLMASNPSTLVNVAMLLTYLVAVPFLIGRLQRQTLSRHIMSLETQLPEIMHAFSSLRTTDVQLKLRGLRAFVDTQRPRQLGWSRIDAKDDLFNQLLDSIRVHIDVAAEFAQRDNDSRIDEMRSDPRLILQYFALPLNHFTRDDITVLTVFLTEINAGVALKRRCLEQLIKIQLYVPQLREVVLEVLGAAAENDSLHGPLRKLAKLGRVRQSEATTSVRWQPLSAVSLATSALIAGGGVFLTVFRPAIVEKVGGTLLVGLSYVAFVEGCRRWRPEQYGQASRLGAAWLLFVLTAIAALMLP